MRSLTTILSFWYSLSIEVPFRSTSMGETHGFSLRKEIRLKVKVSGGLGAHTMTILWKIHRAMSRFVTIGLKSTQYCSLQALMSTRMSRVKFDEDKASPLEQQVHTRLPS